MEARLRELIDRLRKRETTPAEELAESFSVSTRTVRTYVKRANMALRGVAHVKAERGRGYRLVVEDGTALDRLVEGSGRVRLPSMPRERVAYLADDLLSRSDWITLDELSELLYVSRTTISGDLRHVESALKKFDLSLERRPHHGIRVVGSEVDRRLCLASLVVDSEASDLIEASGSSLMLGQIDQCISSVASGVQDFVYRNLLVHIAIAIMRIRKHCYVPMDAVEMERLRSERSYDVAQSVARSIEKCFDIELPEEEVAYIAIHLGGKQMIDGEDEDGQPVISDEVWELVARMIELVRLDFRFDLGGDLELRMNLARHIVPLSVRMRHHMSVANPILQDIKQHYPLAYHMALDCAPLLVDAWGFDLIEDEVGYIALSFALALERARTALDKKSLLVVCATGEGSARLLECRLRQEFGTYIDRIVTCDASCIKDIDLTGIDYVISTVPLGKRLSRPTLVVNNFLEDVDISNVRSLLGRGQADDVSACFPPDLFLAHLEFDSKELLLDYLIDQLCERRRLPTGFRDLVWRREEVAQTSFGNQVAIPHPMEAMGNETVVCVGINEWPVDWGGKPVRLVLLTSVAREKGRELQGFYRATARFVTDATRVAQVIREQRHDGFVSLIECKNPT